MKMIRILSEYVIFQRYKYFTSCDKYLKGLADDTQQMSFSLD